MSLPPNSLLLAGKLTDWSAPVKWIIEQHNGFWYCVRNAFRVRDSFLCRNERHAQACADYLNIVDREYQ